MKRFLLKLFFFLLITATYSQNKKTIDSINKLYVQGLNIPQNSIITLFKKNAENALKISYEIGAADAYSQLSLVYAYQGNYEESAKNIIKAIPIYEKLGIINRLAMYYAQTGYSIKYNDLENALYLMQKGKAIAEENNLEHELKDIYNNYGVLKEINKELDSALHYYEKSLKIKQKINDSVGIPYNWSNMAGVYSLQGNFSKSREYFNKSLQQRLEWSDSLGIAENYTQLGEVFIAENKWKQAIPLVQQSLPISIKKQYKNLTQYNYKLLSDIYKKLNKVDSALYYFEQYTAIKDSVHGVQVQEKIAALNIEFETEKKENEILKQRALIVEKDLEVRRKNLWVFGSLAFAIILGLLGYLLFSQQKLKNRQLQKEGELKSALAKIETQNKLQEQRLRISRDLHDNIGAQLTFIISSIDNLKFGFTDIGEKLGNKLTSISNFTSQTIYELRDTIWAMNKENITFEDLQARISNFIEQARIASEKTNFSFEINSKVNKDHLFSSVEGMNVYRIIQEAVNNALKYSEALQVQVLINLKDDQFIIKIIDNGRGFNTSEIADGNGINNMKKRARELHGNLEMHSITNSGTSVILNFPVQQNLSQ